MTDLQRERDVVQAFVSLVDSLLDDFDIVELLTTLTERCAQLLDVATAGLLLADAQGELHLMAATSRRTHDLEIFQLQSDQGPCLDCYRSGAPVSVANLAESDRWPLFVAAATEAGFASVHAVPMRAMNSVLGALGLFGTAAGALSDHDLDVAQALAHVATVAILQNQRTVDTTVISPGLRNALLSRITVDQATGFVYERTGLSMDDSFRRLRDYAHRHRKHLTEISRQLLDPNAPTELFQEIYTS
jgi:GAF domain-containing protein